MWSFLNILERENSRKFAILKKNDNLFNPFSHMYNGFSHQARISNCSWTSELWFGNITWKFYEVGNTVISLETKKVTFRPRSSSFTLELLKVGKITFELEISLPNWKHHYRVGNISDVASHSIWENHIQVENVYFQLGNIIFELEILPIRTILFLDFS